MKTARLVSVWKAERPKNWSVHMHAHNYYELVYYTKGSGITNVLDSQYTFQQNMFVLNPPEAEHSETHLSDGEVICLGFSMNAQFSQFLFTDASLRILNILQDILSEAISQAFGYKEIIESKLQELYIQIQRLQKAPSVNTKNFEYIIRYLAENYHEKILLSSCAKQLNISYDYFQHRFKQLTGYSPQAFLLKQRLSAAKQLLEQGNLSCTEIAYRCGFSTSAQFSMLFKKSYGITPGKYRLQGNN